jgi:hypothetical protein
MKTNYSQKTSRFKYLCIHIRTQHKSTALAINGCICMNNIINKIHQVTLKTTTNNLKNYTNNNQQEIYSIFFILLCRHHSPHRYPKRFNTIVNSV